MISEIQEIKTRVITIQDRLSQNQKIGKLILKAIADQNEALELFLPDLPGLTRENRDAAIAKLGLVKRGELHLSLPGLDLPPRAHSEGRQD